MKCIELYRYAKRVWKDGEKPRPLCWDVRVVFSSRLNFSLQLRNQTISFGDLVQELGYDGAAMFLCVEEIDLAVHTAPAASAATAPAAVPTALPISGESDGSASKVEAPSATATDEEESAPTL